MSEHELTRRALLQGAAGGAAALGLGALPAWARPVAGATRLRRPHSLPFPHLPAGHPSMPEIRHIVVLMMENHSFDNILGMAGHEIRALRCLDGLTVRGGKVRNFNRDAAGRRVYANHAATPCQLPSKPSQAWNASHTSYDGGRNDGFGLASWLILPNVRNNPAQTARGFPIDRFYSDAAAGRLPQFSFIDPNYTTTSEENPQDIQVGERFVSEIVHAVLHSPNWRHTALFVTYDEHGGYYDHVPPPRAIPPDAIKPQTYPGQNAPGGYDRYGFRVPLIVVSPWARRNYISRVVQDHTSMLAFIERKWNLPALTYRDANADPITDYFDFSRPTFAAPPAIAAGPALGPGLARCRARGFNPPLPPGVG